MSFQNVLFDPILRSNIAVQDALSGVSSQVAPSAFEIQAIASHANPSKEIAASPKNVPPPGGYGAGVNFDPSKLHFRNSTAAFYHLLIPHDLGGNPTADLLYMTSSNRASKGCEALVSFFKDRNYEVAFMIWDWSVEQDKNRSQFVVTMSYDQTSPYRIPLTIQSNTGFGNIGCEVLNITNVTRRSGNAWVNEVYLHNHATGLRDRVWQHSFQWPTKDTDDLYWWGPIFETFPKDAFYNTAPALGFTDAMLVQDGVTHKLLPDDSTMKLPSNDGLVVLWKVDNSGLIAKGDNALPPEA
jgi:hypothetical protein